MKETEDPKYPKALREVWEMKEAAQKEMEGKTWEEQKQMYHQGLIDAANFIGAKLVKLPNGNYRFE